MSVLSRFRTWTMGGLGVLALTGPAAATTFALIIGIDEYAHLQDLDGAVNDALDIEDALSELPDVETTLLLNEEATRERIFQVWRDYIDRASPSDTIIVTYAGHGAGEPAAYPGTEDDGQDETLLLSGFSEVGDDARHRIRDDEIAAMIAASPDTPVIFVADSCHSGTVTRATDFDLAYRFHALETLVNDPLPPPPPPSTRAIDLGEEDNLTFFGAVGDAEQVPEIRIAGTVRGALSYAFADGIRGAADMDRDGLIEKGELEIYIRKYVKQLTTGRQRPKVSPVGVRDRPLLRLAAFAGEEVPSKALDTPFADLPKVTVRSEGPFDATPILDLLDGVTVLETEEDDDVRTVIVNLADRSLRLGSGDRLARLFGRGPPVFRAQIQQIVDKLRGMNAIEDAQRNGDLDVWFPSGNELYFDNDPVQLVVDGRAFSYPVMVNVPSDGTIEPIFPPELAQSLLQTPAEPLEITVRVFPPYGADHIIAIETDEPNPALMRALNRHAGFPSFAAFWDDLHFALKDVPHNIAVHAFFTSRGGIDRQ